MACARSRSAPTPAARRASSAALTGIVGFKPTQARIPLDGAFPLSFALDSDRPDGEKRRRMRRRRRGDGGRRSGAARACVACGLQAGVIQGVPLEDLDGIVSGRLRGGAEKLAGAGLKLRDMRMARARRPSTAPTAAAVSPPEAFAIHRKRLETDAADIDPNVRGRIERAAPMNAADYIDRMCSERVAAIARRPDALCRMSTCCVVPTTPIVAPTMRDVADRRRLHPNGTRFCCATRRW